MTWQFVIAGFAVGVLVGMTGMGGGSLMTPMLILIFGFDPKTAVGTDLLHGAVFKSFGAWRHRRLGNVNVPLAAWILIGSGPCSLVGVELANSFSDTAEATMSRIIGGALIVGGIGFLARTFVKPRDDLGDGPFRLSRRDKIVAVLIGASCGFVVGLTSVGSGTFFGLFMLFLFPLSATQMVGTDVTQAAALLWIAGAGYLLHGNVDLHAIAWLLVGSIPGVFLGANLSIKVPGPRSSDGVRIRADAVGDQAGRASRRDDDHRGLDRPPDPRRARLVGPSTAAPSRSGRRPGIESSGRGPGPVERTRTRPARGDCRCLRDHRGRKARALSDLRDERPHARVLPEGPRRPGGAVDVPSAHARARRGMDGELRTACASGRSCSRGPSSRARG